MPEGKKPVTLKFGGTSLGTAEHLTRVAEIIKNTSETQSVIVVVSAISPQTKTEGTTSKFLLALKHAVDGYEFSDILKEVEASHLELVKEILGNKSCYNKVFQSIKNEIYQLKNFLKAITILGEISPKAEDKVISVGEKLSAMLLTEILCSKDIQSKRVDLSTAAPYFVDLKDREFYVQLETNIKNRVLGRINSGELPVVGGFIGNIPGGLLRKVGRGYTDLTASIIATGTNSVELQIWKEVDGIFTADPQVIDNAKLLSSITQKEAVELTFLGSQVLHPWSIEKILNPDIPIRIKNTNKPQSEGTLITKVSPKHIGSVRSITLRRNIILIKIYDDRLFQANSILSEIFKSIDKYDIKVDLVAMSQSHITISIHKSDYLGQVMQDIRRYAYVTAENGFSVVSIVGEGINTTSNIAGKMLNCLNNANIKVEMISQGSSEMNISCVVKAEHSDLAIKELHSEFILKHF